MQRGGKYAEREQMKYCVTIQGIHYGKNRVMPGLNDKLAGHNKNYQTGNKMERDMLIVCLNYIRMTMRGVKISKPVRITYTHYEADYHRDLGNIAYVDKPFEDALQKAGVLPNDNLHYVCEIHHIFGGIDKLRPRIEIVIEEVDEITTKG